MEYQIEDSLRFFGSSLPKEEQDRLKEFMTIKNKIVKNQMDRKMLQEKKAKELLRKIEFQINVTIWCVKIDEE